MNNYMLRTDLSKRVYGLDIIRALAILSVLLGHTYEYLPKETHYVLDIFTRNGVTMFFVLSGFLIGGILIKTFNKNNASTISLFKFWINRWIRTLPPYFFILILNLTIAFTIHPSAIDHLGKGTLLKYFVFLQNFRTPHSGFFSESWSLSVEEWFYIIIPITAFILVRLFKIKLKFAFILTIISIISVVCAVVVYRSFNQIPVTHQVISNLDKLMYGVLGAFIVYYYNDFWNKWTKQCLFIGVALFIFSSAGGIQAIIGLNHTNIFRGFVIIIGHLIIPISILFTLPYLTKIKTGKGMLYKFITYTSLISYSLYLLHHTFIQYYVIEYFNYFYPISPYIRFVCVWILTYILAQKMYLWLEKPCIDLRKKIKFLNE